MMAVRCCWSLSTAHPSVAQQLVALGCAEGLVEACTAPSLGAASSTLLQVGCVWGCAQLPT